jgi:ABC-type amino acid transport system permease subunit
MGVLVAFLHRYLSPFIAGVCAAAATVVSNVPMAVVLLLAAALFGFVSLPAGVGMIRRIAAEKGG